MPLVLVTGEPIPDEYVRRLQDLGFSVTNGTEAAKRSIGLSGKDLEEALSQEETRSLISEAVIYMYGGLEVLDADVLSSAERLKLITFFGTGWDEDGCVDAAAAHRLGLIVTNTPHANSPSVAELAMGLIVIQSRNEFWLNKENKEKVARDKANRVEEPGKWIQGPATNDVSGRTLGIVGMGHVGRALARHAHQGFGMEICYSGPHPKTDAELEFDANHLPLDELMRVSDFVSISSPAGPTKGLITFELLQQMQSHAILINLAGPAVVDGEGLYRALSDSVIKAAAMDGKYDQDLHERLCALDDDRFIIVPRTAWLTTDSNRRQADMALESIDDYQANRQPLRHQQLPSVGSS